MKPDWNFGDVLRLPERTGHDTFAMFVTRKTPLSYRPNGSVEFWGFTGLYLPPRCRSKATCHFAHFTGLGNFGGHPDARHNDWEKIDADPNP